MRSQIPAKGPSLSENPSLEAESVSELKKKFQESFDRLSYDINNLARSIGFKPNKIDDDLDIEIQALFRETQQSVRIIISALNSPSKEGEAIDSVSALENARKEIQKHVDKLEFYKNTLKEYRNILRAHRAMLTKIHEAYILIRDISSKKGGKDFLEEYISNFEHFSPYLRGLWKDLRTVKTVEQMQEDGDREGVKEYEEEFTRLNELVDRLEGFYETPGREDSNNPAGTIPDIPLHPLLQEENTGIDLLPPRTPSGPAKEPSAGTQGGTAKPRGAEGRPSPADIRTRMREVRIRAANRGHSIEATLERITDELDNAQRLETKDPRRSAESILKALRILETLEEQYGNTRQKKVPPPDNLPSDPNSGKSMPRATSEKTDAPPNVGSATSEKGKAAPNEGNATSGKREKAPYRGGAETGGDSITIEQITPGIPLEQLNLLLKEDLPIRARAAILQLITLKTIGILPESEAIFHLKRLSTEGITVDIRELANNLLSEMRAKNAENLGIRTDKSGGSENKKGGGGLASPKHSPSPTLLPQPEVFPYRAYRGDFDERDRYTHIVTKADSLILSVYRYFGITNKNVEVLNDYAHQMIHIGTETNQDVENLKKSLDTLYDIRVQLHNKMGEGRVITTEDLDFFERAYAVLYNQWKNIDNKAAPTPPVDSSPKRRIRRTEGTIEEARRRLERILALEKFLGVVTRDVLATLTPDGSSVGAALKRIPNDVLKQELLTLWGEEVSKIQSLIINPWKGYLSSFIGESPLINSKNPQTWKEFYEVVQRAEESLRIFEQKIHEAFVEMRGNSLRGAAAEGVGALIGELRRLLPRDIEDKS